MSYESYLANLNATKKVGAVKQKLLRELWGNGETPAGEWVLSKRLLEVSGQKYFDRRLREMRDEHGIDLEHKIIQGNHSYRLVSTTIGNTLDRTYLSEANKKTLFKNSGNSCEICGKVVPPGIRGLQADHKIPLSRNGSSEFANWQSLCVACNVAKRRACQNCEENCSVCPWAFPDSNLHPITFRLPKKEFEVVNALIQENPNWLKEKIWDEDK